MPNILIKVPKNAFDLAGREKLGRGIHAAAKAVEGWGDDPRQEALTWVLIEEVPSGNLFVGGADQSSRYLPVIVFFYPPAGVLGPDSRAKSVALIHAAVSAAKSVDDKRMVLTSIMIWDVADGTWGANGQLWRLPDFARAAGYRHLQHLLAPHAVEAS
jgi:phenylpyruvate tautomerase PptA (4-oxalocrotonate tautomerase family)